MTYTMKHLVELSDQNLVDLCRDGDSKAFEELYNRYWSKLYSSAFKRIKVREVAEEIVQELFTSLWTNREKIAIHTSFQNYLYSSVAYLVFAYLHKEYKRRSYEESALSKINVYDNSTEEIIAFNDLGKKLENELKQLPDRCRSVFELSRKQYKSNKEIASVMGISEKTVENQITKALRILRVNLKYLSILLLLAFTWV